MKTKSETCKYLQVFYHLVENQFNTTIKTLRSDNYFEFDMRDFYHHKRDTSLK